MRAVSFDVEPRDHQRLARYTGQVITGLVGCGVVAATIGAYAAAAAIVVAIMAVVLVTGHLLLRGGL